MVALYSLYAASLPYRLLWDFSSVGMPARHTSNIARAHPAHIKSLPSLASIQMPHASLQPILLRQERDLQA